MNNGGVYGLDYWAYVEVVACSRSIRHSKLNCSFIQRAAYEHDSLFSYEEICSLVLVGLCAIMFLKFSVNWFLAGFLGFACSLLYSNEGSYKHF